MPPHTRRIISVIHGLKIKCLLRSRLIFCTHGIILPDCQSEGKSEIRRIETREYEEIKLLKQSEKSTVHLLREKGGEQMYVRKRLAGQHPIYRILQSCNHPCMPKLYEVTMTEDSTTVIEEYIEGQNAGTAELTEKQFLHIVRDLCSVLESLHGKGIIHRDIKPSNIILTEEGGVYLIDFDAARMPKTEAEQDTQLLGTRGYAAPEQYGFAQTDERTDIYALGVTLEQLLPEKSRQARYKKIIRKCMNLNPDERYQSVRQVRQAFFRVNRVAPGSLAAVLLLGLITCLLGGVFASHKPQPNGKRRRDSRPYRLACTGESSLGWGDRDHGVG